MNIALIKNKYLRRIVLVPVALAFVPLILIEAALYRSSFAITDFWDRVKGCW